MTSWFADPADDIIEAPVTGWWADISVMARPAGAALTITGGQPRVVQGTAVTPAAAALAVAGGQPNIAVTQHKYLTPTGAALTIIGSHPAIGTTLRPGGAALSLTGGQPVVRVSDHKVVQPGGATLAVTGGSPNVDATQHKFVQPTAAPLTITGGQPVVFASDHKVVSPSGAALALTGGTMQPSVGLYFTPIGATLSLVGGAPEVKTPILVTPTGASLAIIGSHPALGTTVRPTAAAVAVTGGQPVVVVSDHKVFVPSNPALIITGGQPVVTASDHKLFVPGGRNLAIAGGQPLVTATDHKLLVPTGLPMALTGGQPTVTVAYIPVTFGSFTDGGGGAGNKTFAVNNSSLGANCIVAAMVGTDPGTACTYNGVTVPRVHQSFINNAYLTYDSYLSVFVLIGGTVPTVNANVIITGGATASAAGAFLFKNVGSQGTLITDTASGNVSKSNSAAADNACVAIYTGGSTNFGAVTPNDNKRTSFVAFSTWGGLWSYGMDSGSGVTFAATHSGAKSGVLVPLLHV